MRSQDLIQLYGGMTKKSEKSKEEHMQNEEKILIYLQDIAEGIGKLDRKIDAVEESLNARMDAVEESLNKRIDAVEESRQRHMSERARHLPGGYAGVGEK